MKIYFLIIIFLIPGFVLQTCSPSDHDLGTENFKSERFLKEQLAGKWKYWGRFSIDRNTWIRTDLNTYIVYEFNLDKSFSYKNNITGVVENGNYEIFPADEKTNSYIMLYSKDYGKVESKKVIILTFDKKYISIFETPFEEKYEKL